MSWKSLSTFGQLGFAVLVLGGLCGNRHLPHLYSTCDLWECGDSAGRTVGNLWTAWTARAALSVDGGYGYM